MSSDARRRRNGEAGFTLIELLVVILIIGILAAIAIPSFFNQSAKAKDSSAKELARTAETTAESYATDHDGSYTGISPTTLQGVEPSIATSAGGHAYLSAADTPATAGSGPNSAGTSYTVTATSETGNTFSISRSDSGIVTRTCSGAGGAGAGGCVGNTW
jgi:type IV pilus assembly protein PilA